MQIMISGGYLNENRSIYKTMDNYYSIAYIPSWFKKESIRDFNKFKKKFKRSNVKFYPLEDLNKKNKIKNLFKSDIIYIDGGNTFVLLNYLKKFKLINKIKKFAKNKILIGMSAGSIIQTSNINLAKIPFFNADENLHNLVDLKSMNLVNFEIFPHFYPSDKKELRELTNYSKINNKPIYLIPDGSSIVLSSNKKLHIGRYWVLKNGKIKKGINFLSKKEKITF